MNVLEVVELRKHFPIRRGFLRRIVGHVRAVDGVTFHIRKGETLALVGESGCGIEASQTPGMKSPQRGWNGQPKGRAKGCGIEP